MQKQISSVLAATLIVSATILATGCDEGKPAPVTIEKPAVDDAAAKAAADKAAADAKAAADKAAADKAAADKAAADRKAAAQAAEKARLAAEKAEADRKAAEEAARRIEPAKALKVAAPVYPESARRARQDGQVTVTVEVKTDGTVATASAVGGNQELRDAAVAAARNWTFVPATRGGKPITCEVVVPVEFVLKSKAK